MDVFLLISSFHDLNKEIDVYQLEFKSKLEFLHLKKIIIISLSKLYFRDAAPGWERHLAN